MVTLNTFKTDYFLAGDISGKGTTLIASAGLAGAFSFSWKQPDSANIHTLIIQN